MFLQILSFLHNLTTMLFGIFISAFFLGLRHNSKNICTLLLFSCFEGALYICVSLLLGADTADRLYALIIHLPLILFLILYYKYPAFLAASQLDRTARTGDHGRTMVLLSPADPDYAGYIFPAPYIRMPHDGSNLCERETGSLHYRIFALRLLYLRLYLYQALKPPLFRQ